MTCVWNAIESSLNSDDRKILGLTEKGSVALVKCLKRNNCFTNGLTWQGLELSSREAKENYHHIRIFDVKTISNGYLCSSAEPFMFLLCFILQVNITHNFNGVTISYRTKKAARRTLKFRSSKTHMSVA